MDTTQEELELFNRPAAAPEVDQETETADPSHSFSQWVCSKGYAHSVSSLKCTGHADPVQGKRKGARHGI
jgi:hypothetical protein